MAGLEYITKVPEVGVELLSVCLSPQPTKNRDAKNNRTNVFEFVSWIKNLFFILKSLKIMQLHYDRAQIG
jgi:hypothetical protein